MEGIHGNIILCYSSKLSLVLTAAVYNCLIIQEFSEFLNEIVLNVTAFELLLILILIKVIIKFGGYFDPIESWLGHTLDLVLLLPIFAVYPLFLTMCLIILLNQCS